MARRKRKQPSHPPAAQLHPRRPVGLWVAIGITLVLAGIPFALGKYIEFNSPGPFDSGAYVYSAKHLLDGAQMGIEERSSARPNTLLANILGVKLFGFSDTGPKLVQMVLQLAAGVFMFYTLRRIFGSVAAVLATTVAAVYLSAPLIAKFGNVKEQYMIAFMLYAGCAFLLYELTRKRLWLLSAGFFALQPYYFKATGMSIVIAIVLYVFLKNLPVRNIKNLCLELFLFQAGYAAGLLIPLSLFVWQNQTAALFRTFPPVALVFGLLLTGLLTAAVYAGPYLSRYVRLRDLKTVSVKIWLIGLAAMLLALGISLMAVYMTEGYRPGDIAAYLRSLPFIAVPAAAVSRMLGTILQAAQLQSGYLTGARAAIDLHELAAKIGRYYMALKAPILLAAVSMLIAAVVWIGKLLKKNVPSTVQAKVVWMLAAWWVLDMAFIWVSPRSYEQYYLPLCASAAMLSGYAAWKWTEKFKAAQNKIPWSVIGFVGVIILTVFAWPIFAGQRCSPDTGADYIETRGGPQRGFTQALKELPARRQGTWHAVGEYIQTHSTPDDTIYVWGWVPGIYVKAQRLAPVPAAFESDMHVMTPSQLRGMVNYLVQEFKEDPPKFIVDTRKRHIPWNRPPLELWPHTYSQEQPFGQPIPNNPAFVQQYNTLYKRLLAEQFDPRQPEYRNLPALTVWVMLAPWSRAMPDEAERYEAMQPLREFVMSNYRIVGHYGEMVLFQLKQP